MINKINVLVLCGGGGSEHEVSLVSAKYIVETLRQLGQYEVLEGIIEKSPQKNEGTIPWTIKLEGRSQGVVLGPSGTVLSYPELKKVTKIDIAVPCIHGPPGETGDIQSYFELLKIPYFGPGPEASKLCFNKVSTKLWLDALGIANTPFLFLADKTPATIEKIKQFHQKHGAVFVKASNQGSSIGCYPVAKNQNVMEAIDKAFQFSPYVLVEKSVTARELEISVFNYQGKIHTSYPGEINCPSRFYSYEEKYNPASKTTTEIKAPGLTEKQVDVMKAMAKNAFQGLKLRHLSRVDFFLTDDNQIYLNEINSFPGMTPISMFPKMMEASGVTFADYLQDSLAGILKELK